jgi:hypothetical protein
VANAILFLLLVVLFTLAFVGCDGPSGPEGRLECEIASRLSEEANRMCREAGGLPMGRWERGFSDTRVIVRCEELSSSSSSSSSSDSNQ